MPEPVDVYSDQFQVSVTPYGITLSFMISNAAPPAPGTPPAAERVANIRMSQEHLKVMVFILRKQLVDYERQMGVRIQIPMPVLHSLQIGLEDWEDFWEHS